jgi:hypothetical protein
MRELRVSADVALVQTCPDGTASHVPFQADLYLAREQIEPMQSPPTDKLPDSKRRRIHLTQSMELP